jgi:hypothetical protein
MLSMGVVFSQHRFAVSVRKTHVWKPREDRRGSLARLLFANQKAAAGTLRPFENSFRPALEML